MGYRSNVRVITTKKGFEEIKKFIENELLKEENRDLGNVLDEIDVRKETDNFILFGWGWIKYNREPYSLFQESLERLEELDISYSFSIIGEETGDIEEYRFDSEKEKDTIIPLSSIICEFDDEDTMEILKHEEMLALKKEINQLKEKIATYEMNDNEMECDI